MFDFATFPKGAAAFSPSAPLVVDASLSHIQRDVDSGELRCMLCPVTIRDMSAARIHVHVHVLGPARTHMCAECPSFFPRIGSLSRHATKWHSRPKGSTMVECDVCHKVFRPAKLRAHVKIHIVEPVNCAACGRTYAREDLLLRHKVSCRGFPDPVLPETTAAEGVGLSSLDVMSSPLPTTEARSTAPIAIPPSVLDPASGWAHGIKERALTGSQVSTVSPSPLASSSHPPSEYVDDDDYEALSEDIVPHVGIPSSRSPCSSSSSVMSPPPTSGACSTAPIAIPPIVLDPSPSPSILSPLPTTGACSTALIAIPPSVLDPASGWAHGLKVRAPLPIGGCSLGCLYQTLSRVGPVVGIIPTKLRPPDVLVIFESVASAERALEMSAKKEINHAGLPLILQPYIVVQESGRKIFIRRNKRPSKRRKLGVSGSDESLVSTMRPLGSSQPQPQRRGEGSNSNMVFHVQPGATINFNHY